jgi:serine O-acetyltransferase
MNMQSGPAANGEVDQDFLDELSKPHTRGCLRSWRAVALHLKADLIRYHGGPRFRFWRHFLFTPGYKYTVWMRLAGYLKTRPLAKFTLYPIAKYILLRCRYKFGIAIPEYTDIGPGLFINRFGGIYVHGHALIGHDVTFSSTILIGQTNRGRRAGAPILGNRIYVGVGSRLIGRIEIGDGSVIGVNAVVTKDLPPNSVAAGIPAKILSQEGSGGYINRTVPPDLLAACYAARGLPVPPPASAVGGMVAQSS